MNGIRSCFSLASQLAAAMLTGHLSAATILPASYTYDGPAGSSPSGTSSGSDAATLLNDNVIAANDWNTTNGNVSYFNSGDSPAASVTFTFSSLVDFTSIDIYEHDQLPSGIDSVEVLTSTDGIIFTSHNTYAFGAGSLVGGTLYSDRHSFDISAASNATHIRLNFESSGSWMSLTEIDFDGTVVPEPAVAILLVFGGLGFACRRRR